MTRGAEIFTPGIGPATDGLSGFELFEKPHAPSPSVTARTKTTGAGLPIMESPRSLGFSGNRRAHKHLRTAIQLFLSDRKNREFRAQGWENLVQPLWVSEY